MQCGKFVLMGLSHEDSLFKEWIIVKIVVGAGMDGCKGEYLMEMEVGAG